MFKELRHVRQEPGEHRRLFERDDCDLWLWYGTDGVLTGFQLVYAVGEERKALTWSSAEGYSHTTVDGWDSRRSNRTPLLVADGTFPRNQLLELLGPDLAALGDPAGLLVLERLRAYPLT